MKETPPPFEQDKSNQVAFEKKDKTILPEETHNTQEIGEGQDSPEIQMRMEIHREMVTEEHDRIGIFEKLKGKAFLGVATALAGLSFVAAAPNWSYSQDKKQSQNTFEMSKTPVSPEAVQKAKKILQANGIKMIDTGAGNIEYTGPGLDLSNKIERQSTAVASDLAFSISKVERNYGLPEAAPDLEKQIDALKKILVSAQEADNAFKPFFNGGSIFQSKLELSRERLARAEELLKKIQGNKDAVEKIRSLKQSVDKLDQKNKQQSFGLEMREQQLQKELQRELQELSSKLIGGSVAQTPEKNTSIKSATPPSSSPSSPSETPAETPAQTMKRVGGELSQSAEKLNKLNRQLQEELQKIQGGKK